MSISTELTRMAGNAGALAADTNAIFEALRAKGVDVPADAQLSDVVDMIGEIVPPLPQGLVAIVSGTKHMGFDSVNFTDNSAELVTGVLDSPVYANVGTSFNHCISTTDTSIINLIQSGTFTIEFWFMHRATSSSSGWGSPLFMIANTNGGWNLGIAGCGNDLLMIENGADEYGILTDNFSDRYHHISYMRNSSTGSITIHTDGKKRHSYIRQSIGSSNILYMPQVYNQRSDYNIIQFCIYDYEKYTTADYVPSTQVINF